MTSPGKVNKAKNPPYKTVGFGAFAVLALLTSLVYVQFRGGFTPTDKLTMLSERAGLVMDPGSKVTYNGVQIGRVDSIREVTQDGKPAAKFGLLVDPKYLGPNGVVPENVHVEIKATTVFGGKYVSLTTPRDDNDNDISRGHLRAGRTITASAVTTEINTMFQTLTSIAEKVDPVKLNLTLSAAAEALTGLGDRFGEAIVNANAVLDDVNPQMPQARRDVQQLAALGDVYADAAPDLMDFLDNSVPAARTINAHQRELDQALLAAAGLGNNGADVFERGGPYLARGMTDSVPTSQLLDTYSPEINCTLRKYYDMEPVAREALGGNGYSLNTHTQVMSGLGLMLNPVSMVPLLLSQVGGLAAGLVGGAPNPYTYPENLPRVNARGGPGGAPGCWQHISRELWPAPELVMDTGNSIAPYNHLEVGSPFLNEYVWGRQVGDNTINP
ncbi:MCE family protein [Mycobacterium sp.]|uniref:MCE family protein n=1 Tax=Mycobacterium sp. TaxID=1785 RepID=UPI003A846726